MNITDGDGNLLVSDNFNGAWGETAVAKASDSKLPYDVSVDFLESTQVSSRMVKNGIVKERFVGGPSGTFSVNWEDWKLTIAAGDTKWDDTDTSGMPYCSVGGWDNGNFGDWLNSLLGGYSEIPVSQMSPYKLESYSDLIIESAIRLSLDMLVTWYTKHPSSFCKII